jgi:prepilin-type N-terminal cleavage/methylation domain-containing protein
MKNNKGFTLIELLLVVTILSLLAVTVFAALNPTQRLTDTKNARRTADVDSILMAIHQSILDNKALPTNMAAANTEAQLGSAGAGCAIATGGCAVGQAACANLLIGANNISKYLKTMPIDPLGGATYDSTKTGYSVMVDSNGLITVRACGSEGGLTINESR